MSTSTRDPRQIPSPVVPVMRLPKTQPEPRRTAQITSGWRRLQTIALLTRSRCCHFRLSGLGPRQHLISHGQDELPLQPGESTRESTAHLQAATSNTGRGFVRRQAWEEDIPGSIDDRLRTRLQWSIGRRSSNSSAMTRLRNLIHLAQSDQIRQFRLATCSRSPDSISCAAREAEVVCISEVASA